MTKDHPTYRNMLVCVCVLTVFSCKVHAEEGRWHSSGFLNQTIIHTTDNNFFGATDDNLSFDYWEAGLLAAGNLTKKLELSSQLLARRAGKMDDGHPHIDQLLLTYRIEDDFERSSGFRIGRSKQIFGLYNETRDVPFTRPSILLPQSTYFDRSRNSLLIADEVLYFKEVRKESGTYKGMVGTFRTVPKDIEMADFFGVDVDLKTHGDYGSGALLTWRSPMEQWYTGIEFGSTRFRFEAKNTNLINPDGSFNLINSNGQEEIYVVSVFLQYTLPDWTITTEVTRNDAAYHNINTTVDYMQYRGLSHYIQVDYRINQRHDVFARFDSSVVDIDDPKGKSFEASAFSKFTHIPGFSQYSNDASIGYAYHPSQDWMLRLELHNLEGTSWIMHIENKDPDQLAKHWNMAMAQLSYRF